MHETTLTTPLIAPYGAWQSPITLDMLVTQSITLSDLLLDGTDLYWLEGRPAEAGRFALVRLDGNGVVGDVLPVGFNVRTRVHEYGGRAYAAWRRTIYFSNFGDQRVYRADGRREPRPLTPEQPLRFADFSVDPARRRLICVREDHRDEGEEPINALVAIDMDGDETGGQVLVSGADFYAWPRLSPDGDRLCWISWNHPNMPWDGSTLWMASIREDGTVGQPKRVAGGADESIFQPEWSADGLLYFVSDRTGWWNLYRYMEGHGEPLCPLEAEFGRPQWTFGGGTYTFESPDYIVGTYAEEGAWHLFRLHTTTGERTNLDLPFTQLAMPLVTFDNQVIVLAASPVEAPAIVRIDTARREYQTIIRSSAVDVDPEYLSRPRRMRFPTDNGHHSHAHFYPPSNKLFAGPEGERPPLIVFSHGGPSSAANDSLKYSVQFWTSRGFAVVDVDYGGSTGYGRAYRERLLGQWGVVDVNDCVSAARYLVEKGYVDENRLIIRGGSAGGYTTLCALTFHDVFRAGASYFGIGDLEALARTTHKFESRYLDRLVGPYPEAADLYRRRSPIHAVDRLHCPAIFFQGLEDRVVTPDQSREMANALAGKGLPVASIEFSDEGHGFRKAENIKAALGAELYFYGRVLEFSPADDLPVIKITNLD